MKKAKVIELLKSTDQALQDLYQEANSVRQRTVGEQVYLRGIIEFSNYCRKDCAYCGIQKSNSTAQRYRMTTAEILAVCAQIEKAQQTTVVLQSGEDLYFTQERMADLLSQIKASTQLAITVSAGERSKATYQAWQAKGMDRYLLRFETSNPTLFQRCHPDSDFQARLACLSTLQALGVQTGSGFLMGLPFTEDPLAQLAEDILFCTSLNLAMIGVGPFIAHPATPLAQQKNSLAPEVFFKAIAILRILNPRAHIPATTAFDTIQKGGRDLLLVRGANVFMPNMTPQPYRQYYELYPGKPCIDEAGSECAGCVLRRLKRLGRPVGQDQGHSLIA